MWIDGNRYMGLAFWEPEISTLQMRMAMINANHGLNIIYPKFILPKFELEPFSMAELKRIWNYKRANTSRLRLIIRKQKKHAIKTRREQNSSIC